MIWEESDSRFKLGYIYFLDSDNKSTINFKGGAFDQIFGNTRAEARAQKHAYTNIRIEAHVYKHAHAYVILIL